jgi:hypothetical protein
MSKSKSAIPLFVGEFPAIEESREQWKKHGFELELVQIIEKVTISPQPYKNLDDLDHLDGESKELIQSRIEAHDADAAYIIEKRAWSEHGTDSEKGELIFLPVKLKPIDR